METSFDICEERKDTQVGSKTSIMLNGYTFYIYTLNNDSDLHVGQLKILLVIVEELIGKDNFTIYLNNLANSFTGDSLQSSIDMVLRSYTMDVKDQTEITLYAQEQEKNIRLQFLIILSGSLHQIYYPKEKYFLFQNKNRMNASRLEKEGHWLKKNCINSCIRFIETVFSDIERSWGIYTKKPWNYTWLTPEEKDLFRTYGDLIPFKKDLDETKQSPMNFKQLLYLFVNDVSFTSKIDSFNKGKYVIQFNRYLSEFVLWFRFIRIYKIALQIYSERLHSIELANILNEPATSVVFISEFFSNKMAAKMLYLFHEGMDHYVYRVFNEHYAIIYQILYELHQSKKK